MAEAIEFINILLTSFEIQDKMQTNDMSLQEIEEEVFE